MASLPRPQRRARSTGAPMIQARRIPRRAQSHQTAAEATARPASHSATKGQAPGSVWPGTSESGMVFGACGGAATALPWSAASTSMVWEGSRPPTPAALAEVTSTRRPRVARMAGWWVPGGSRPCTMNRNGPCPVRTVMTSPLRSRARLAKGAPAVVLLPTRTASPPCPGSGVSARWPGPSRRSPEDVPSITTTLRMPAAGAFSSAIGVPSGMSPPMRGAVGMPGRSCRNSAYSCC